MFSNTLQVIRHYLSSAIGDLEYGVCGTTDATTSKIHAPFLWRADDYYNNHHYEVYVYAGTNIGEARDVKDWVNSSLLMEIYAPAYGAACDASSYIELHYMFKEDEYRKAINLAIESAVGKYLIDKIDVAITLVANTFEYTLPTDVLYVDTITTEDEVAGGVFGEANIVDPRYWRLISPRKLKLHESYYSIGAGRNLRLEGQGTQPTVDDDTDIIYLPPDWLIEKAITFLPLNKITSNDLKERFNLAVARSAVTPNTWPHPKARKVVE